MSVAADLFGVAYLDAESFRSTAKLFGAGVAMGAFPTGTIGNASLGHVLQAASRAVDQFCGKVFTPANITEKQRFQSNRHFIVNNPPVAEIVSCSIRFSIDGTLTIPVGNVYINNQQGYCEITELDEATQTVMSAIGSQIDGPIVEVVYKSLQTVPNPVKLATGYQAAHMINKGFVEQMAPSTFGAIDLGGMSLNNKKGGGSGDGPNDYGFSPDAAKLLVPYRRFVAA